MSTSRLIVFPKDESINKLKMFTFHFSKRNLMLGLSEDFKNLYQVIQIGATDKKNSWFYDNQVISALDGSIYGFLKVLKGWIFLSLYSKFSHAKSIFMTVDDLLSHLYDESEEDPVLLETISTIYKLNKIEIETFLEKIMPSQVNIEGNFGFKFDVLEIAGMLYERISKQSLLSDTENFGDPKYFEAKWGRFNATVAILDNLQMTLPEVVFTGLCDKLALYPATPEELNKRFKTADSMILKPIKAGSSVVPANHLLPTNDYSKIESKLKSQALKTREVKGNSKISAFFKISK